MSRSYRCVILAAVGWLIVSAAPHPNPTAKAEQAQPGNPVGESLQNIATIQVKQAERTERPPQYQPCGSRQYESNDDLCAQWKAADAAADASWWAKWATWIGGISSLFVIAALLLAFQANRISRRSHEVQTRPVMTFLGWHIEHMVGRTDAVLVAAIWKNVGVLPALIRETRMRRDYLPRNPTDEDIAQLGLKAGREDTAPHVIASGDTLRGTGIRVQVADLRGGQPDRQPGFPFNSILCSASIDYRSAIDAKSGPWRSTEFDMLVPIIADDGSIPLNGWPQGFCNTKRANKVLS